MGKTSASVKNRYAAKAYKRIVVMVPKAKAATFESKLLNDGHTKNGWLNMKINEYLLESNNG